MRYLHTMVRVADLDAALAFWRDALGLQEISRMDNQKGRYRVSNIYDTCARLAAAGITINRPPRDGHMAFVRSPDGISIELLQEGASLAAAEPWSSMANTGSW